MAPRPCRKSTKDIGCPVAPTPVMIMPSDEDSSRSLPDSRSVSRLDSGCVRMRASIEFGSVRSCRSSSGCHADRISIWLAEWLRTSALPQRSATITIDCKRRDVLAWPHDGCPAQPNPPPPPWERLPLAPELHTSTFPRTSGDLPRPPDPPPLRVRDSHD